MSLELCQTAVMIHRRRKDGLVVARIMYCHRRDCESCQTRKAKKYLEVFKRCPVLYYKTVPTKDVRTILDKVRSKGGFFWRCNLRGNATAIVSTVELNRKWIPFPYGDDFGDDSLLIMFGWLMKQVGNVSMTRFGSSSKKEIDEYDQYIVKNKDMSDMRKLLTQNGYKQIEGGLYAPTDSANWDAVMGELVM